MPRTPQSPSSGKRNPRREQLDRRTALAGLALASSVGAVGVTVGQSGQGGASAAIAVGPPLPDVSIRDFGAMGDGRADDTEALERALASLREAHAGGGADGPRGGRLRIPAGVYRMTRTIEIDQGTYILEGEGVGMAGGAASILRFPPGVIGLRTQRFNTRGDGAALSKRDGGGDGSIVRQLALVGGGGPPSGIGILARSRCLIENVIVSGFGGHGILIRASGGSGGATEGNANNWQVNTVRLSGNGGSGLRVEGADANAGLGSAIDASLNKGWGIDDASFLGNTYVACHCEGNGAGAYRSSGRNARSQLLGCYSESGQPTSQLTHPAIVWGGLHGAGIAGTAVVLDNQLGALTVTGGVYTTGGLGVGNAQPASRPGRIVGRTEIYDPHGKPIGFLPIFDRID